MGEQPLSPLPHLPLPLQDLIISYLPEDDITSPRLLARVLNNLYKDHPERIGDLVKRCPRALFVAALQKTSNEAMKRSIIAAITKQTQHRANDWCRAEYEALIKHQPNFSRPLTPRLQQLLAPDDPDGVRADFIRQQIEEECNDGPTF